jgi:Na+/H+ antiporter NhaD/arsenite permease-like protein
MHPSVPLVAAVDHEVPAWLIAPFALLILLIAAMPLTRGRVRHFWDRAYLYVAPGLGLGVALWYLLRVPGGGAEVVAALREYGSFVALIGSLYVIAGGLHLGVRGTATPGENTRFLALGALAANLVGTTGASMVLIRPWLRMNAGRRSPHHVVFFIFIVSNCGGALTPIGDPPLFLGYLRGVPFFWLASEVLAQWLFVVSALLGVFWCIDRRAFRAASAETRAQAAPPDRLRLGGRSNLLWLAVVIGAVFIPSDLVGLREAVMLAAAAASHRLTPRALHEANGFSFAPIREVAVLFLGIFLTMVPALDAIARHGPELGVERPLHYYVATGSLSAVLDNAPTYATFFELALGSARRRAPENFAAADAGPASGPGAQAAQTRALLATAPELVVAVSLGAVFFGAMTYIGNGPNFMVKAIAEDAGAPTPGFFAYVLRYALPILLPILLLSACIFL